MLGGLAASLALPSLALPPLARPALAQARPLRVGMITSLSGPFTALGESMRAGMRLLLAQSGGAFAGRAVELLVEDDQAKPRSTTRAETTGKPWAAHFTDLYRYATGWLGWTPATAWDASCDEITTAFAAHVGRLVAVNGGKRDDEADDPEGPVNVYSADRMTEIEELGHDPAFQRDKLRALKARMG